MSKIQPYVYLGGRKFHHASDRFFHWPQAEANPQFQFLTYGPGFYVAPMESNNKNWGKYKYSVTFKSTAPFINGDCRISTRDLPKIFPNAQGKFKKAIETTIQKDYWSNGLRIRDFLYEMTKNKIPCYLSKCVGIVDEGLEIVVFDTGKDVIESFGRIE